MNAIPRTRAEDIHQKLNNVHLDVYYNYGRSYDENKIITYYAYIMEHVQDLCWWDVVSELDEIVKAI